VSAPTVTATKIHDFLKIQPFVFNEIGIVLYLCVYSSDNSSTVDVAAKQKRRVEHKSTSSHGLGAALE
jgi:hypothetical protein